MTTIGMNYDVIAGKEAEFERSFDAVRQSLAAAADHLESRLLKDVDAPGSYVILSRWKSDEAFHAFIRSPAFAAVTAWGKREILRGPPVHTVFRHASESD